MNQFDPLVLTLILLAAIAWLLVESVLLLRWFSRPRGTGYGISLLALLVAIALLAVGLTALLNANTTWARVVVSSVWTAFVVAALVVIAAPGARRRFAAGFLLAGTAYLWIVFGPLADWFNLSMVFVTEPLLGQLREPMGIPLRASAVQSFFAIAHHLVAMVAALGGALGAEYVGRRCERE